MEELDAKVKHKDFCGFKTEFVMTTDDRIITSVRTANGSYMDGNYANEMLAETKKDGIMINEVYGDKAYFRKSILDDIQETKAKPYIPVSSFKELMKVSIHITRMNGSAVKETQPLKRSIIYLTEKMEKEKE